MKIFRKPKTYSSDPPTIEELVANRDHNGLIKILENEKNEDLRCDVVVGLAEIGDKKAWSALANTLHDRTRIVKFAAAHELVKTDAPYTQLLIKRAFDDKELRAFQEFSQMKLVLETERMKKSKDVKGLINAFNKSSEYIVRIAAVNALAEIGDEKAIIALIKITDKTMHSNPEISLHAFTELFKLNIPPDILKTMSPKFVQGYEAAKKGEIPMSLFR